MAKLFSMINKPKFSPVHSWKFPSLLFANGCDRDEHATEGYTHQFPFIGYGFAGSQCSRLRAISNSQGCSIARVMSFVILALLLCACGSQPQKSQTLADIDTGQSKKRPSQEKSIDKSQDEVKQAYYDYLSQAAKDDKMRVQAATRIAELELGSSEEDQHKARAQMSTSSDAQFERTVRKTIKLLSDTVRDFPNAEGNDHTLYQLAKAHDQIGESDQAVAVLEKMVAQYPLTPYYIEAKFRIAEHAFVNGHYFKSEDAYTDVLKAPNNEVFIEKAMFKRGWARYKQEMYFQALDDYYAAVERHSFAEYDELVKADQELFDEYFRAIGLSFSYMGGAEAISDYFAERGRKPNAFATYRTVSALQLKQERYSDAVATLESYMQKYPQGKGVIKAGLEINKIWKDAGFFNRYVESFSNFYQRYNAQSSFWLTSAQQINPSERELAITNIRSNIVLLAGHYHNLYQKREKPEDFQAAQTWYERYLQGYSSYAKQDKIYQLYAELLNKAQRYELALTYYEKAAFDGEIVLDKDSAYASVYLTDRLFQNATEPKKTQWLNKHLEYAQLYGQLYPSEPQTPLVIQHAVQMAFSGKMLEKSITLANILPDTASGPIAEEVSLIKAQAYFNLGQYQEAEFMYQDLLQSRSLSATERKPLVDKLALSIYQQAEEQQSQQQVEASARNYLRVYSEVPESELAPTAMYDAIALFMSNQMWDEAIDYLNIFNREYPNHPFQKDVTKKLSVAYLRSNRSLEAAREFEKLSDFTVNQEEKMAALWQAAELYHSKGDINSSLRAYKEYAHAYPRPYAQNMEAMNKIADIYQMLGDKDKRLFWLNKIVQSDVKATVASKTERTQYVAASASFSMAQISFGEYKRQRLVIPLAKSLKAKKSIMQETVKLYGQAAVYGHQEFVTQSTLAIGDIYRDFAKALLASERPNNLNADELEQYNILLEDQAFPFEDKAIEFYQTNVSRIPTGIYDPAVKTSLRHLAELFPARYGRAGKVETYIEHL